MDPNLVPDKKVASIVKALAMVENGGKIPLDNPSAGQSGEMKSIFQFTPGTWKMYSKEILGKDNVPLDNGSESVVTYGKVKKWVDDGFSPEEIASIWNSGKPDSYLQGKKGTNKYGVKYDVPGYVAKFKKYLGSSGEQSSGEQPAQMPQQSMPMAQSTPPAPAGPVVNQNTLPELMQRNMKQSLPKQVRQI